MANGEEKSKDFYAVLGLKKECTELELRNAYKKLALKWHPDRCSASENSKYVEEAKKKFQAIQQAYSVLSDANKRFLYDVGVYDSDDDENGMGDFLNEMAVMMSQTKSTETREESFEELQELFEEMFQGDMESFSSTSQTTTSCSTSSSSYASYCESSSSTNKRSSFEMNYGKTNIMDSSGFDFDSNFQNFCLGVEQQQQAAGKEKGVVRGGIRGGGTANNGRRNGRKQKVSSGHDVSSSSGTMNLIAARLGHSTLLDGVWLQKLELCFIVKKFLAMPFSLVVALFFQPMIVMVSPVFLMSHGFSYANC